MAIDPDIQLAYGPSMLAQDRLLSMLLAEVALLRPDGAVARMVNDPSIALREPLFIVGADFEDAVRQDTWGILNDANRLLTRP